MEKTELEREDFALSLTRECKAHDRDKWLSIMRFGIGTLKETPGFLMELIVDRAQLEFNYSTDEDPGNANGPNPKSWTLPETAKFLMKELNLKLVEF